MLGWIEIASKNSKNDVMNGARRSIRGMRSKENLLDRFHFPDRPEGSSFVKQVEQNWQLAGVMHAGHLDLGVVIPLRWFFVRLVRAIPCFTQFGEASRPEYGGSLKHAANA